MKLIETRTFPMKKIEFKMSSAKWWPFVSSVIVKYEALKFHAEFLPFPLGLSVLPHMPCAFGGNLSRLSWTMVLSAVVSTCNIHHYNSCLIKGINIQITEDPHTVINYTKHNHWRDSLHAARLYKDSYCIIVRFIINILTPLLISAA